MTESSGVMEQEARRQWAGQSPRDALAARRELLAKGNAIEELEFPDPRDLSQDFRIRTTTRNESRDDPAPDSVRASIPSRELLARLPLGFPLDGDEVKDQPLTLAQPYHATARWRLVPPRGFRLRSTHSDKSIALGPARLEKEFHKNDDGSLVVELRFDTVQSEFSREEAAALRKAYSEEIEASEAVVFEDRVESLLREGHFRAALNEARRRTDEDPNDAFSRYRLVRAYLAVGAGASARTEAQRLADEFPEQPAAQMALGEAFSHDLLGRDFAPGFDHDRAAAAYRRALELRPKNRRLTRALVEVLKRSPEGAELAPGAEVDEAIQLARELVDEHHNPEDLLPLRDLLSRAERYEDLAELMEQSDRNGSGTFFAVEATAALRGLEGAQAMAARFPQQDARNRSLFYSGLRLAEARRYAIAAELIEAGRDASTDVSSAAQSVAQYRKTRRHEDMAFPSGDPRGVVIEWMRAVHVAPDWKAAVQSLVTRRCGRVELSDPRERQRFDYWVQQMRHTPVRRQRYLDRVLDEVLAFTTFEVEGDDRRGYRVRATYANAARGRTLASDYFVVREEGDLRLLDSTDAYSLTLAGVACQTERLLDDDLEGARRLLDWATQIDNSFFTNFRTIWCADCERSLSDARLAIAILRSRVESLAAAVMPILREAYGREQAADRRLALNRALAFTSELLGRREEALALDHQVFQEQPDFVPGVTDAVETLGRLGRWGEAQQLLQEHLKQQPQNDQLLRSLLYVEMNRGDWDAAAQAVEDLERLGKAGPPDRNNLAWTALVAGSVNATARAVIERAAEDTHQRAPAILNTQAAIYAASGDPDQARRVFLQAMKYGAGAEPRQADWYVAGLIAEGYGLVDEAREAYRRALADDDRIEPASVGALAQQHLAGLK
jgi:tetratricopeptide (TPR) repeat protein